MKGLIKLAMVFVLIGISESLQAENKEKHRFVANTGQLVKYLGLDGSQINKVSEINEYFILMQDDLKARNERVRKQKMEQAIFTNLKLLKEELTEDQYRKYVAILNVTYNNQRLESLDTLVNTDCLTFK